MDEGRAIGREEGQEQGRKQGRKQGREQGREENIQKTRSVLEQILIARFGRLPKKTTKTIAAADFDTVTGWLLTAATAKTLADVGIGSAN